MKQYAELKARRQRLAQFNERLKERVRRREREKGASVSQLLPERDRKGVASSRRGHSVSQTVDRDEVQVVFGSGRGVACQQLVVYCGQVRGGRPVANDHPLILLVLQCSPDSREDSGGRSVPLCSATDTMSATSSNRGERIRGGKWCHLLYTSISCDHGLQTRNMKRGEVSGMKLLLRDCS